MVQVTGDHLARDAGELDRVFLDQVEASHLGKVLGVDVSAEDFAQAVREHKPQVLGMSALLTTTMLGMQDVVDALKQQGLRDKVKVIIGGGPVSKMYAEQIGADGYGNAAAQAVKLVRSLL